MPLIINIYEFSQGRMDNKNISFFVPKYEIEQQFKRFDFIGSKPDEPIAYEFKANLGQLLSMVAFYYIHLIKIGKQEFIY